MNENFKHIIITIISLIFIILFVLICCGFNQNKVDNQQNIVENERIIEYAGIEEYKIGSFETLSHIATKYIPSNEYMQQWIEDVKKLNNRKTNDVYFDEIIKVYYYKK